MQSIAKHKIWRWYIMNVQERVAEYVQNNGIMQKFIAERTGLSAVKVSNILNLNQKMTADELELFCRALRKEPGEFIKIED
jgi:transcriptional regulator with XRE-family HTH domain